MNFRLTSLLAVTAALVLGGCSTPSIHGFAKADRVTLDGLDGVWVTDDTITRIEATDDTMYVLTLNGSRHTLALAVAEIDGQHVADATLNDDDSLEYLDPILLSFIIPVHKFARLRLDGDTLEHAELKDEWVGKHAGDAVATFAEDQNLITGSSAQVRALLAKALKDEDAWESGQTFTRLVENE